MKEMKPYSAYKSSNIEWLGDIPEHWETKKLKFIANINPSNVDKNSFEEEESVFLCNYVDVYKNDFIRNDLKFMGATATKEEIKKFVLKIGDVIITKDSETAQDIAVPALVVETMPNLVCGYHLTLIRSKAKSLLGEYLFRVFQGKSFNGNFEMDANGVTRFAISNGVTKNVFIPLPPLEEQQAIAQYLDQKTAQIERFIANKTRLIELLKEEKTAYISELMQEAAQRYESKKLKYVVNLNASTLSENENPELEIEYIDIGNVNEDGLINEPEKMFFKNAPSRARRIAKKGDVIISTVRTYLKAITQIETDKKNLIVSTGFATLTPTQKVDTSFLHYTSKSDFLIHQIAAFSTGIAYPAINACQLGSFKIPIPPLAEQEAIVAKIQTKHGQIDAVIIRIQKEIDLMKEYKTALISEAVTGKIKVV